MRFYIELVFGTIGLVLFAITLIWNEWIEIVFHVDPDAGNGAAEYVVCFVLLVAAAVSFGLARSEWRPRHVPAEQSSS